MKAVLMIFHIYVVTLRIYSIMITSPRQCFLLYNSPINRLGKFGSLDSCHLSFLQQSILTESMSFITAVNLPY